MPYLLPPFQTPPIVYTLLPEEKILFNPVLPVGAALKAGFTAASPNPAPTDAALLSSPISLSASLVLPGVTASSDATERDTQKLTSLSTGWLTSEVRQVLTDVGSILVSSGLTSPALGSSPFTPWSTSALTSVVVQNAPPGKNLPPEAAGEPIDLKADRQEYNQELQTFTASGNVLLRFRGAVLRADQLRVDLRSRVATAEGNIILTRGDQVLQGERLEYRLTQDQGTFLGARGTIYLPTAETDFSPTRPIDASTDISADAEAFSEELRNNQPLQARETPSIQQLRFEAERIEFDSRGWRARAIRITNDPFSPPELEVRAAQAELVRVSPLEDQVTTSRPRLVFDQGLSLPILKSKTTIDRQERDPTSVPRLGFDQNDRGGVFLGQDFEFGAGQTSLRVTPQFFVERAFEDGSNLVDPDAYGVTVKLRSDLGPRSLLSGFTSLTSLDPSEISDNLRARLSLRQGVGSHTLTLESSYRDRLFNGSLGEQTVESNFGGVFSSPLIQLGNTGIDLTYQVGAQYTTAESDGPDLGDQASLGRFQASAGLSRSFYLWRGEALPPTATGGLRYTPNPVVPYLQLLTGVTGVLNTYTNGDTQQTLIGTVGFQGQLGHFSRQFFDYTGFNISYSQVGQNGLSPFLFDRVIDFKVLSAGVLQQVYGPLRVGVQSSFNLDTGEQFDTDIILDYSRRTYGLTFRYSPSREVASVNFRLNGFNWNGNPGPFSEPEIRSVEGGIQQTDE